MEVSLEKPQIPVSMEQLRSLLGEILALGERTALLTDDTPLLGNIPELDSMAVAALISAMEERYGFTIEDDDIDAETFATLHSLWFFVQAKLAGE